MNIELSESCKAAQGINRRELLTAAGTAAASLALSGVRAYAFQQKTLAKPVVVGSGDHKYECIHDWLTPPDDILWGDTQGITQDSKGRIYISHTVHSGSRKQNAIVVFDRHGKYLDSWGAQFVGGGHGIELRVEGEGDDAAEYLYHCDTAHRKVVKTTLTGKVIWEKGTPQEPGVYKDNSPFIPTNVAFSPNGDFYVADGYGSNYVHQYNLAGDWIRTFGGGGDGPGKFKTCHGILVDTRCKDPELVVTDRASGRNQYFTLEGKFLRMQSEGMRLPSYFSIHGHEMAIADLTAVVTILDINGKPIVYLGDGLPDQEKLRDHPRADWLAGKFVHPHCVKYLHNGDILVAEWVPIGRVTLLKKLRA